MSHTLVTRLAALLLILFVATTGNAGGPATGQGNAPAALLLEASVVTPALVGLAPGGSPIDSHVTTTWLVRAIAGLTGHQHAGDDEDQKHSFFVRQTLQVLDSSGTVVRTIATEAPCPAEVGPTPDSYQRVLVDTVWDGRDSTGQPREGVFTFSVETRFERRDEKLAGRNAGQMIIVPIADVSAALPGTVTCDFTAPQIVITRPLDGSFVNRPQQTIDGYVVEDNLASLVSDGRIIVPAPDGTFSFPVTLTQGPDTTITVTAEDLAGNASSTSVHLTLDLQPPTITSLQPPSGSWTNALEVSLTGRVEDDFGVASALVDGTPVALASDGTFTTVLPLPTENPVQTTVEAQDLAGNATSLVHEVFVDRTAPVVELSSPPEGATVGETVTVVGRVIEQNPGSLTLNGATVSTMEDGTFGPVELAVTGESLVMEARAVDLAGNETVESRTVHRLLAEVPTLSVELPLNGFLSATRTVLVRGLVTGGGALVVSANGTPLACADGLFEGQVELAEGAVDLTVVARNETGEASQVVSGEVDSLGPEVTEVEPEPDSFARGDVAIVSARVVDAHLAAVTFDGLAMLPDGGRYRALVPLSDASSIRLLRAVDTLGHETIVEVPIRRDDDPPVVTLSPPRGTPLPEGSQTIVLELTDELSGIDPATVSVTLDGADVTSLAQTTGTAVALLWSGETALARGSHELVVSVADRAGNRREVTAPLVVDDPPPVLDALAAEREAFCPADNPYAPASSRELNMVTAVDRTCSFETTIRTADGRALGTLVHPPQPPGLCCLTWDGTLADGRRLAPGHYCLTVTAVDEAGRRSTPRSLFVRIYF